MTGNPPADEDLTQLRQSILLICQRLHLQTVALEESFQLLARVA